MSPWFMTKKSATYGGNDDNDDENDDDDDDDDEYEYENDDDDDDDLHSKLGHGKPIWPPPS